MTVQTDAPAETPPTTPDDTADPPKKARRLPPSSTSGTLIATVAITLLWAGLCNSLLNLMQTDWDFVRLIGYDLGHKIAMFAVSATLVWAVILIVLTVTGRLWLTLALTLDLTLLLGFANQQKLEVRREPLYPSDFSFAGNTGFLSQMVDWKTVVVLLLVLAALTWALLALGRRLRRLFPRVTRRGQPRAWRRLLVARCVVLLASLTLLGYATQFNDTGNRIRLAYEDADAAWAFWYQKINYQRHGFVAGFLYNTPVPAMQEPEGYTREAMADLTSRYQDVAAQLNAGRSAGVIDDVNIVLVLSEAFSDPTLVGGVEVEGDPIPFTRDLMSRTTSGEMLAQLYGGGTANMEFEALTGQSLSQFEPQMNTPYQMMVPKLDSYPSAVELLESDGHEAIAIHPYMTSMYHREEVYPTLGIDSFIHDTTMQDSSTVDDSEFISDGAAFDETLYQLHESDDPLLVNLVTMQNHYPMADWYDDPWPASAPTKETEEQLSGYARGLAHTDAALKDFVTELETSDEKTVVVFYGDHQPGIWPDDIYQQNGDQVMRRTPFFIWSNFAELEHDDAQPVTSPVYFMPMVYNLLGAELPPYYALLTELQAEIPAMEQGEYYRPDGALTDEAGLSDRARELLEDYRLVQYDLSIGERYAEEALFSPQSPRG